MPTQAQFSPIADSVQSATERVSKLGETAAAAHKQASEAYLSSYEKAVVALADTQEKAAGVTNIDWIASLGSAQANATREIARAYTSAARELVA